LSERAATLWYSLLLTDNKQHKRRTEMTHWHYTHLPTFCFLTTTLLVHSAVYSTVYTQCVHSVHTVYTALTYVGDDPLYRPTVELVRAAGNTRNNDKPRM